jgi:MFS family permease
MLVASLLIYFTGYPAFEPGLPAYATVEAHVSAHIVALSVTVNTSFIVVTQLIVLRLVRRLRRSRALALVGLIWAASWVVFGLAALPIPLASRVAFVFTFTALFGLGETFVAPTLGPLLNTLAADRVRGRANSLSALAQSLSFIVSPAIATGLIAAGAATVWISLLCVGCLGTVAIGTRLSRALTIRQDRANAPPAAAPPGSARPGRDGSRRRQRTLGRDPHRDGPLDTASHSKIEKEPHDDAYTGYHRQASAASRPVLTGHAIGQRAAVHQRANWPGPSDRCAGRR